MTYLACGCSARLASRSTPRRGAGIGTPSALASAPIVDTWWQTETGAIMISPLPGVAVTKPGSAMTPLPGISAKIVGDHGNQLVPGADCSERRSGYLVLDQPWPSMARGIWRDP